MKADKPKLKRIKPNVGVYDDTTVKLDFDGDSNGNPSLKTVKYWAKRGCRKFDLKGLRIFKSSKGSYHVVFNRSVSWKENFQIMSCFAIMVEGKQLKNCPLTKYVLMCGIKGVRCLRISKKKVDGKNEKPRPRTVFKFEKQNNEIKNYLQFKRNLRDFL